MANTTGFQNQGPAFRATGKGLINKLPNFVADANNANAVLINRAFSPNDPQGKLWLFCTGVSTGWHVQGSHGQGPSFRTFYPRTLIQDEIQIKCIVANQYQYDLMVEFVQQHHQSAINSLTNTATNASGNDGGIPVEFKLFPYRIKIGLDKQGQAIYKTIYDAMHYEGFIPTIQSGHDRMTNAPAFIINLKVSKDFIGHNIEQTGLLNTELQKRYVQTFGSSYAPPLPPDLTPATNLIETVDKSLDNAWHTVDSFLSDPSSAVQDFWGAFF